MIFGRDPYGVLSVNEINNYNNDRRKRERQSFGKVAKHAAPATIPT